MLPILNSNESRAYDTFLIKKVGIPSLVLMENAARGAVATVREWLADTPSKSVLIFCGKGNNGGDGLALARLLIEQGIAAYVVLTSKQLSKEATHQLNILKKLITPDHIINFPFRDDHFLSHLNLGVIVDALLGTGAEGVLKKPYIDAVLTINGLQKMTGAKVLSLDVPTGMNSDSGEIETVIGGKPVCVFADRTVTMGTLKQGFFQGFAPDFTGEIAIASLGAPAPEDTEVSLLQEEDVISIRPSRFLTVSKYDQGYVLSIAGSKGMSGAAVMSANAAIRSGCGLVTVATVESERAIVASSMPEIMTATLDADSEGAPQKNSLKNISSHLQKADVVLLGPGIRNTEESNAMMLEAFRTIEQPIVADAGALGALAGNLSVLKKRKDITILTPHAGEMSRMLGVSRDELEIDRIAIASHFAREYRCILVLKGAPTVIALPNGKVFVNSTGNPGMATAGCGDVLAGMIAGILAQEPIEPEGAVLFAVYAHGRAGDVAAMNGSMQTLIASDIIASLHTTFNQLQVT